LALDKSWGGGYTYPNQIVSLSNIKVCQKVYKILTRKVEDMRALRVSCIALVGLFAIILFFALESFAGEITKDDIILLNKVAAKLQQTDLGLAKEFDNYVNKVKGESEVSKTAVPAQAQKPAPRIAKEIPPTIVSTKTKDFWLLEAPEEWPAQVMPGVIAGSNKPLIYFDNLVPLLGTPDSMIFADVKAVIGSNGSNEQNIGTGARTLLFDEKLILGTNFFYDTRYTENRVRHNQLAFGLESLSEWVDLRSNFYFPISGKKYLNDQAYYGFRSRSLALVTPYEEPLPGLDYEGGILIPYLSDYVETRALIGGYNYFPDEGKGVNGIKGRIEIRPIKGLTVNVEVKHDNYSGTQYFVETFMSVPLDTMNVFKVKNPFTDLGKYFGYKKGVRRLRERMVDRIVRDINVVIDPQNPTADQKVHDLTYVDNSYTGTSDGTLEHPYKTVQTGVDGVVGDKWVYVKQGSGTYGEAVDLTLANNAVLWGSGYNGGFSGLSVSGVSPVINPAGAYGVTLGDNNTVMGLQVTGATTAAIYSATANNATISNNIITSNTGDGIRLFPAAGNLTATITDNTITDNTGYSINLVSASGTTLTTTLANNTLSSNGGDAFASNGVIATDLETGLVWAADGWGAGCNGDGSSATQLTWADATDSTTPGAWLTTINSSAFGGYTDWRLPSIVELEGIIDYSTFNPAINATAFPNTQSDYYWSSTTVADNAGYAWFVGFYFGNVSLNGKTSTYYVRAVRGGQ